MAMFEVEVDGRRFQVDAPSMEAAVSAARQMAVGQQALPQAQQQGFNLNGRPSLEDLLSLTQTGPSALVNDPRFNTGNAQASHDQYGGISVAGGNASEFAPPGLSEDMHEAALLIPGQRNNLFQAATLGLGDNINGLLYGPESQEHYRAEMAYARENDPGGTMFGDLLGGLPVAAAGGWASALPATFFGQMLAGGAVGAGTGALYGADAGGVDGAIKGGLTGGGIGAAVPVLGPLLGAAGRRAASVVRRTPDNVSPLGGQGQTAEGARAAAQADYAASEALGVAVSSQSFDDGMQNILINAQRRLSPRTTPKAQEFSDELFDVASRPHTLEELDDLRQYAGDLINEASRRGDRALVTQMVRDFDGYLDGLTVADLAAGTNPEQATALLQSARANWAQLRKIETIEDRFYRATLAPDQSSAGRTTALRNEFRSLLKNESAMRGFTAAERAAMEAFVRGGPIENTLRRLGGSMPRVMGSIGLFIGEPTLIAGAGAGMASRGLASALSNNRLASMDTLVRGGETAGASGAYGPLLPALQSANVYGNIRRDTSDLMGPSRLFGPLIPAQ